MKNGGGINMTKLSNGEYVLTMKEKNKCILRSMWDKRVIYYPDKEYKLIVKDGIHTYFDEMDITEALHTDNFLSCFSIKKVA